MQIDRKVTIHFDLNVQEDIDAYSRFQNMQNIVTAICEFKNELNSLSEGCDKEDLERITVIESLKAKYIHTFSKYGVRVQP